ncbi:unnamed protein product [Umbelopsis ramanniana]
MADHNTPYIPLDIWLTVFKYLQPQDLLNSASTCRTWYKSLTNQTVWREAYNAILPEYASDHFCIPYLVGNAKRLDINHMNGSEPTYLDYWPQSFKQRTVYLQHVMHVQSKALKALRENTSSFEENSTAPIFDMARIKEMEDIMQSAIPIDLVVYMYHFTHHLPVIQIQDESEEDVPPIASGVAFESTDQWQKLYEHFDIREYMRYRPRTPRFRLQEVSRTTMKYMLNSNDYECDGLKSGLTVMLSKNDSPPADLPPFVATDGYEINLESTINSIGKAFIMHSQTGGYVLQYVGESFTDYFLQYTGVALTYGKVPLCSGEGKGDLTVDLPRDHSPRISVLLPQPIDCWDINSYFPTFFTHEKDFICDFNWKEKYLKNVK